MKCADLLKLHTDIESEHEILRGIDLGFICDAISGEHDASEYKAEIAGFAAIYGYRVRCHAMTSNGDSATRYYIAEVM